MENKMFAGDIMDSIDSLDITALNNILDGSENQHTEVWSKTVWNSIGV